jgi:transglutaminase-like putative cysteine protease
MNLASLTGSKAFGRAYRCMLDNDPHAPGSADREIVASMIRLCDETAGYLYDGHTSRSIGFTEGARPGLERLCAEAGSPARSPEHRVDAIADLTRGLAGKSPAGGLSAMRFGGTEEQIIERGSDWCADVARVACALYQVAGSPCRMVYLFDLRAAYSGHVIVEVHRSGRWGAVDPSSAVVYRAGDGTPATTWELMNDAGLVKCHAGPEAWYTNPEQFSAAGIADYRVRDAARYDYPVTGVNDYTRAVLCMAERGWPGGLRWLHGETDG